MKNNVEITIYKIVYIPGAETAVLQGIRSRRKRPSKKLQRFVRAEAAFSWVLLSLFQFCYSYDSDGAKLETFYCAGSVHLWAKCCISCASSFPNGTITVAGSNKNLKHLKFKFLPLLQWLLHFNLISFGYIINIFSMRVLTFKTTQNNVLELNECYD